MEVTVPSKRARSQPRNAIRPISGTSVVTAKLIDSPSKVQTLCADTVFEPMNRDFAFGRNARAGSVQMWLERKQHYLDIEQRN